MASCLQKLQPPASRFPSPDIAPRLQLPPACRSPPPDTGLEWTALYGKV